MMCPSWAIDVRKEKQEQECDESGSEFKFRPLQRQCVWVEAGRMQEKTLAGSLPAGQAAGRASRVQ